MVTLESLGIDRLERDEQLALAASLEQHLLDNQPYTGLSSAHLTDLQRRLDEDDANPEDGTPVDEAIRMMEEMVESRMKP